MHTLIFVVPKIPTMHIFLKSYQILVGTQCKLLPQKPTSRYSISFQPTIKNECSTRIILSTRVTLLKILHSIRTYFISVVVNTFTIQMFLECNKPGNTRADHKHISSCTTADFDTSTIPPYNCMVAHRTLHNILSGGQLTFQRLYQDYEGKRRAGFAIQDNSSPKNTLTRDFHMEYGIF